MINRTAAPIPSGNVSFEIPTIKKLNINSGAEILFVNKNKLPIVHLTVVFNAGSNFEPADKNGLAFLTSLLIDEGAGEYDSLQLNNEFEKLGSVISVSSDHDSFSFSLMSLKENFERSFELLSLIINEPWFSDKDFEREKKKMLDRILQLKDEPSFIASSVFDKILFGNNVYGRPEIGMEESVGFISLDDVKNFYKNILLKSEMKIIAVGNITEDEIIELSNKFLPTTADTLKSPEIILNNKSKTKFYIVHKDESAQAELRVGHLSKGRLSEDFYAARLMNATLGGQFSSRININLRERKGFTYGASSFFNYYKNAASFEVSTAVNIQNTGEAIAEILKELNLIRAGISKDEIDFAKSYLIKQFPAKFETYIQIAKNILPLITYSLPLDYYENYTNKLDRVSSGEIERAALENIFPGELVIVAVGDKNIIVPQINSVSGGNYIELDLYGKPVAKLI